MEVTNLGMLSTLLLHCVRLDSRISVEIIRFYVRKKRRERIETPDTINIL